MRRAFRSLRFKRILGQASCFEARRIPRAARPTSFPHSVFFPRTISFPPHFRVFRVFRGPTLNQQSIEALT